MTTTKNLKFVQFVKGLLDILYGAMVFACVALVLWMALSPFIFSQASFTGSASVPVRLGTGEEPQFEVNFTTRPQGGIAIAFVDEAEGTLRLETTNALMIVAANAAKLIYAIGLAYIFYLLRAVVQATIDGEPFSAENGHRLRRLSYAVLTVGLAGPAAENIAATEILRCLPTAAPALNAGPTFDIEVILVALLFLLLSHIWSYGFELERDRALTV